MNAHTIIIGLAVIIAITAVAWLAANNTPVPEVLAYVITSGVSVLTGMELQKRSQ